MSEQASAEKTHSNVATLPALRPVAPLVDVFSDPATFEHAQRVAKVFASSSLVPAHLRGNVADCLIAYQIARRLNEEPLTVFQNIYVVSGRPGWKTEYVIARANRAGVFKSRITWKTEGEGDALSVTAQAVLSDSGEVVSSTCDMKMARADGWTKNAKYTSMPEHMLRWRSAAMLIRLYAPEVMLGMPVMEELETLPAPMRDITPEMRKSLDDFAVRPTEEGPSELDDFSEQNGAGPSSGAQEEAGAAEAEAAGEASSAPSNPPQQSVSQAGDGEPAPGANLQPGAGEPKGMSGAPTAAAKLQTEADYVAYAKAWITATNDPDALEKQWKAEKGVRNKANVSPEAREELEGSVKAKVAHLRTKG